MQQKILKTGNSLAVTIPARFVKILGLRPGQTVEVKLNIAKGTLRYTFTGTGQLTLLSTGKK
jgi:antitoxin component of MazEF toxin-antitoxin module